MRATVETLLALVQRMAPALNTELIEELCPGASQARVGQPYFNGWVGMYPGLQLMNMSPDTVVDVGDAKPLYRGYWVLFAADQSRLASAIAATGKVDETGGWYPADTSQEMFDQAIRAGWGKLQHEMEGRTLPAEKASTPLPGQTPAPKGSTPP